MKTFLLLLTLFAFLQSAFLPINLILVVMIARALVIEDRVNLLLAFLGGLILSFLSQVNLGYFPLVLIIVVKLVGLARKLPVSFNPLVVLLSGSIAIALVAISNSFFIHQNLTIWSHLVEALLVVPSYYLVQIWEERFIVKSHIKLKV